MALINRFNFLVWSTTPPEPEDLHNLPQGGYLGKMAATVVLVPGENYQFYINNKTAMAVGTMAVHLRTNNNQPAFANIGTVEPVMSPEFGVNQYAVTLVVPANLPEAYYRLVIPHSTNGVNWISNRVLCMPSGADLNSAIFSFRNRREVAGIPYHIPSMSGFRQVLRLKCVTNTPQPDTVIDDYQETTTGVHVTPLIKQDLVVPFRCPNTDAVGHEGWQTMLRHKDIFINSSQYSLKTGYSAGNEHRRLSDGSFEMYQTEFSEVNRC